MPYLLPLFAVVLAADPPKPVRVVEVAPPPRPVVSTPPGFDEAAQRLRKTLLAEMPPMDERVAAYAKKLDGRERVFFNDLVRRLSAGEEWSADAAAQVRRLGFRDWVAAREKLFHLNAAWFTRTAAEAWRRNPGIRSDRGMAHMLDTWVGMSLADKVAVSRALKDTEPVPRRNEDLVRAVRGFGGDGSLDPPKK